MLTKMTFVVTCLLAAAAAVVAAPPNQSDQDRLRAQIDNVRRDITRIKRDVDTLDRQVDDRNKQMREAPKTVDPAKEALKDAEQKYDQAQKEVKDAGKRVGTATEKMQAMTKNVKGAEADRLTAAGKKADEARARVEEIKKPALAAMAMKDPAYKAALARHASAKDRVGKAREAQLTGRGAPEEAAEASAALIAAEAEVAELEEKGLWANQEYLKSLKDLSAADAEEDAAEKAVAEKLKSDPAIAAADTELREARKAMVEAQNKQREATKFRSAASGKLATLKSQFTRFAADTEGMSNRKRSLEGQLQSKQRQLDNLERDYRR